MMDKRMLAGAMFCWSLRAFGTDFSEADAKFAQRDVDLQSTLDARAAYKSILETASKDTDKLRAAAGYLRTYLFEGTHYHSLDSEEGRKARKAVFSSCWTEATETINPASLGYEAAAYDYFRSACLAYDAQVSTLDEQIQLVPLLLDAVQKGLATLGGSDYEGGGLYRVAAAVKYNPAAKPLPGGLYNPGEALQLIDRAIAAQPFPADNVAGTLYCENYSHKVRNLLVLDRPGEALALADQSIATFHAALEDGRIPEIFRAETVDCLNLLQAIKDAGTP